MNKYYIKDHAWLRKVLCADALLGSSTAVTGIILAEPLNVLFGLSASLILFISIVTLVYIVATKLVFQKPISISLLRTLVAANWVWTIVSVVILFFHYRDVTALGLAFLFLQILVVGALAWLEGSEVGKD